VKPEPTFDDSRPRHDAAVPRSIPAVSSKPYAGIKVIEFGQFIAVPYCAMLLAQGGADVIKVESLEGDPVRHFAPLVPGETRHYISRNRGKHSLPLNLKHPSAAAIIDALIRDADVVLTNLRPGLAGDLGLDYESLSGRYPRLVVGNVTAFGEKGPDAALAGMDLVVQARSGLMASNGKVRDGLPMAGEAPIIDYMCATQLAFGIASALLRRERTGRGGEVGVNLLMAGMALQNNLVLRVESVDGPVFRDVVEKLEAAREHGATFTEQAAIPPSARVNYMSSVYYRTYATKDAIVAIASGSPGLQRALMRAIGVKDRAHTEPITERAEQAAHYADLQTKCEAALATKTTAEWKAIFNEHGVPAGSVKFPIELPDDEQALANGMFADVEHPGLGTIRVLANPVSLDGGGFEPGLPTPEFGSETRTVLHGVGFADAEVDRFLAEGVTKDHP
jgi:crotonobetainyl-CoA:carnitine CoA-transferase CaiB-like acyl-CoA transferase